ncbi:putative eka-like protein [Erysiphe neolycopersici]|uniref:Putative eka-like protein n=1 Tax=Erysiphe neolycopersici TaxID=212602 RepID=A0A420HM21_9PEZI|nr:putative eka-like protein [Erysiphe neolycopersici]
MSDGDRIITDQEAGSSNLNPSLETLKNLTAQQIQELLNLLAQQQQQKTNIDSQVPISQTNFISRKESPWPSWDGNRNTYSDYRFGLEIKLEEDSKFFNSSRAVCLGMLLSLPEKKRHNVKAWFRCGGSNGSYNWEEFLLHFDEQFEDVEAMLEAAEVLGRMRQGHNQYFEDFLRDFEGQYSLCDVNTWGPTGKIALVHTAINEQLREALVGIDLSIRMGYKAWIAKVKQVAIQLQALQKYRPRGATNTKTWYISGQGTVVPQVANIDREDAVLDAEGDTKMGGLNAIVAGSSQGKEKKINKNKPRAPWRTSEEFQKLKQKRLCIRCCKSGHFSRWCPSFSPAVPPLGINIAEVENENDSGNEEP